MPVGNIEFRAKCGCFLAEYINFMYLRALRKMPIRTLKLCNMKAGVIVSLLLIQFFYCDLLQRAGDIHPHPGPVDDGKSSKTTNSRQTRLQSYSQKSSTTSSPSRPYQDPMVQDQSQTPSLTDIMATLTSMNSSLNQKMDNMRDDFIKKLDDMKKEVSMVHGQYVEIKGEMEQLREEVQSLRQENKDLSQKMDDLQGRSRRNNIIIHGMSKRENETSEQCEEVLKDMITDKLELSDDIAFERVHRINPKPDSPIIACCTFYKQKLDILKARKKLQGTNLFISEDFTVRVRNVRKLLVPHLKKARENGKRATMVYDHLIIDGRKYCLDGSSNLIEMR